MKKLTRTLLLLALTCWPIAALSSGSLRCGERLVEQGMKKSEVEKLCGKPTAVEKYDTVWVYDLHPSQLLKVITFVNGEVEFIDERQRQNEEQ